MEDQTQNEQTKIRVAIFGVGMHFQETYTTALNRKEISDIIDVAWVVDLKSKEDSVKERCSKAGISPKFIGVDDFEGQQLPQHIKIALDDIGKRDPVDAVLISTTPEQHLAYAVWAMERGLSVLLDKPITSRKDAVSNPQQAKGILEDWHKLHDVSKKYDVTLMVNSHRRFHPAYHKVGELLEEVANKYGVGVTSISSFNSDGQWRLPNELVDITYHGFNTGNGVLSHFGYHYIDLATTWYRKGTPVEKRASSAHVNSSFSTAQNYAKQITREDSNRYLQEANQPESKNDKTNINSLLENYGEMDSFNSIEMVKDGVQVAHINLQMLHSGFSQRAWTVPAENLYKENGRVRWESHLIQQGPLHAIEIRTFQAVQPSHYNPEEGLPRWDLGGADQLEINVFRNTLIGGKPLETIQVKDLLDEIPEKDVLHEDVKSKTLQLFVGVVADKKEVLDELKAKEEWKVFVKDMIAGSEQDLSLIGSHQPTVAIMSGCYESYAIRTVDKKLNERVEVPLLW